MKKNESPFVKIPANKIFEDDLEEIISLLKDNSSAEIEFSTENYSEIKSLDELKKLSNKFHSLSIKRNYPDEIFIDFSPSSAHIYCNNHNLEYEGLKRKIENIILKRKRGIVNLFLIDQNKSYLLLFFLIIILIIFIKLKLFTFSMPQALLFIIIPFILHSILSIYYTNFRYSTIILEIKTKRKNFFQREKDKILSGILIAVATALISNIDRILRVFFK